MKCRIKFISEKRPVQRYYYYYFFLWGTLYLVISLCVELCAKISVRLSLSRNPHDQFTAIFLGIIPLHICIVPLQFLRFFPS
jgi:hypothetical protein